MTIVSVVNWEQKLEAVARCYEIHPEYRQRLKKLREYEIVIVCDDSGSMRTLINGTQQRRWDYLMELVMKILPISLIFDSNGVDIYFLNRDEPTNVTDPEEIRALFADSPVGYTPLVPVLRRVFNLPAAKVGHEKKLLVFIATDGAPTDNNGNDQIRELETMMSNERCAETTHVQYLACTDEDRPIAYLKRFDGTMKNVDVTRDFNRERALIQEHMGRDHSFSEGDYLVKALLGAIDNEIDNWDGSQ